MTLRVDPATIGGLASDVQRSTDQLGSTPPAPGIDAGPSSPAVLASAAELMRAAAGMTEVASRSAADLDANRATYAGTEDSNEGMFRQLGR
ncbi:hypothetical protein A8924_1261 [Saccharopolyspora erythraea NRRL 2338]|uniref:Excreted virulence factor EspC (Type VII ESX diderm) n=1 Tax=Saccharopolyspora erythraea TaxID=1836 RepID=A0ABN1CXP3_SACER|nr:hypothetical protein [Saccharopolyspora erythraea]PFG93997.1 hypothetical protein A8924_1261 [Saccharopolyspora erythraea NRRL 2338]